MKLRAAVLRWYRRHRRDLPWRKTRDPYAIWVSEVMLQQTRVETVIPYYERFLARFPSLESLAGAREADVLAAWSGLGYYRRARNLQAGAAVVIREHAGSVPEDTAALRALPGVGAYTAAAIASVAFDRPEAAVDGNVIRVLARIGGHRGRRDSPALKREVERVARELAVGPSPREWTQALMELGALVCLPRDPRCAACPAAPDCAARKSGAPERYPEAAKPSGPPRAGHHVLLVARRGPRVFLIPGEGAHGIGWTLPSAPAIDSARDSAIRLARGVFRKALKVRLSGRFRHRTYAEDLRFEVWETSGTIPRSLHGRGKWVNPAALGELPVRAPTLKALKRLRQELGQDAGPN